MGEYVVIFSKLAEQVGVVGALGIMSTVGLAVYLYKSDKRKTAEWREERVSLITQAQKIEAYVRETLVLELQESRKVHTKAMEVMGAFVRAAAGRPCIKDEIERSAIERVGGG